MKRATKTALLIITVFRFQSTPSVKRATQFGVQLPFGGIISIHTLCEEGDGYYIFCFAFCFYFNPHPLWRGRRQFGVQLPFGGIISIHTLCEEGDRHHADHHSYNHISIHTLCEEGDFLLIFLIILFVRFQSTPSVKRATYHLYKIIRGLQISIHTLCEEGDQRYCNLYRFVAISIHTLCEEGDLPKTYGILL